MLSLIKGKRMLGGSQAFRVFSETHNHIESWNTLRRLHPKLSLPWLCARDFNEIAKSHEKYGGHLRLTKQMQDFQDIVDECSFMDLSFVGTKFTLYKNYSNGGTIWERLERVVGTQEWVTINQ